MSPRISCSPNVQYRIHKSQVFNCLNKRPNFQRHVLKNSVSQYHVDKRPVFEYHVDKSPVFQYHVDKRPVFQYHVYKNSLLVLIPSQTNALHTLSSFLFNFHPVLSSHLCFLQAVCFCLQSAACIFSAPVLSACPLNLMILHVITRALL